MKTIHQTTLKEGFYSDGLTVKLMQSLKTGLFYVYYYIHCEDRHSEYGSYNNYTEANDDYENIIVTYC